MSLSLNEFSTPPIQQSLNISLPFSYLDGSSPQSGFQSLNNPMSNSVLSHPSLMTTQSQLNGLSIHQSQLSQQNILSQSATQSLNSPISQLSTGQLSGSSQQSVLSQLGLSTGQLSGLSTGQLSGLSISSVSSKDKLKNFWSEAKKNSGMSSKCYLDGRYFNHVLSPYEGLVRTPMFIGIEEGDFTEDPNDGDRREFEMRMLFNGQSLKDSSGPVRLIRMIIEIGRAGTQGIARHSNLISIDTRSKKIWRFEPIRDHPYRGPIQRGLIEYFEEILPDYTLIMSPEHPQLIESSVCRGRGMCAAYVLMMAMKVVTGRIRNWFPRDSNQAEKQILRFAFAIEQQFGILQGEPELDYGFFDNWSAAKYNPSNWTTGQKAAGGAAAGAVVGGLLLGGGWTGALVGAGIGGGLGYLWGKSSEKKKQRYYY